MLHVRLQTSTHLDFRETPGPVAGSAGAPRCTATGQLLHTRSRRRSPRHPRDSSPYTCRWPIGAGSLTVNGSRNGTGCLWHQRHPALSDSRCPESLFWVVMHYHIAYYLLQCVVLCNVAMPDIQRDVASDSKVAIQTATELASRRPRCAGGLPVRPSVRPAFGGGVVISSFRLRRTSRTMFSKLGAFVISRGPKCIESPTSELCILPE